MVRSFITFSRDYNEITHIETFKTTLSRSIIKFIEQQKYLSISIKYNL